MAYAPDHEKALVNREYRKALLKDKVFDYDYGELGDKLKPGSELHEKLVRYGLDIARRGYTSFAPYHEQWREADWKRTAYVTPEDQDPGGTGKDRKRNIVVPLTFRMGEMYCSAANGVFIRDPIFRYKPMPGVDSLINAATTEYMVQRHALWFDLGLHCDSVWQDSFYYGFGMAGVRWATERARRPVDMQITDEVLRMAKDAGIPVSRDMRNKIVRDMEEVVTAEGSELVPWDPYCSFYDTSVTPNNLKRAAYLGTIYQTEANQLLLQEREMPERWFNGWYAKVLAENSYGSSLYNPRVMSGRNTRQGTFGDVGDTGHGIEFHAPLDVLYIECLIVPSDWGVGDQTWPVRYMMAIAADEILVGFGPLDLAHGGYSAVICAPNADGHTFAPVSHILTTMGIQRHIDEIMRCTSASMRKNINGGWTIFNHNILNWDDFVNSDEVAKVIRPNSPMLTKEMMEAALINIPHIDNSPNQMRYIGEMMTIASEGNGTVDIGGPGELAGSERPTKFGMQAQVSSTSSRFRRLAYKMGAQMMSQLGWQFAYNLVQFSRHPISVDLSGRFADRIRREMGNEAVGQPWLLDPTAIEINFEMEPYTGAMPQQDDTSGISEIMKVLLSNPEVAMSYFSQRNTTAIIDSGLRKSGFENIEDYVATVQPQPDGAVQEQVQAGNLVPFEGAMA